MSARPFTEAEYLTLTAYYRSRKMTRNLALLVVGCATGFRIEELLSLTVGQVWSGTEVVREITIARRNLKGGQGAYKRSVRSRRIPLSDSVRSAIAEHLQTIGTAEPARSLFSTNRANAGGMHRSQAYRTLVAACEACGIDPTRISTHSMRKRFARLIYDASDLITTQKLMGHTSPVTTARYLEADTAKLDALVLNLAA